MNASPSTADARMLAHLVGVVGHGATRRLIARWPDWASLVAATPAQLTDVGGARAAALAGAETPESPLLPDGVRVVGFTDPGWPVELDTIPAPPAVLWVRGTLPSGRRLAVVGTRRPDDFGAAVARHSVTSAAAHGVGIVSGLADGIDAVAHTAALDEGAATWAVLGCGVDRPEPVGNAALAERIVASGGGLLAEVPPGTARSGRHLVARNRLITGLAQVCLVAQCGRRSGTMHSARFAIEQGRLLVVARPKRRWAAGETSAGSLLLCDDRGTDPAELHASGELAARIRRRAPVADLVVDERSDLDALWPLWPLFA